MLPLQIILQHFYKILLWLFFTNFYLGIQLTSLFHLPITTYYIRIFFFFFQKSLYLLQYSYKISFFCQLPDANYFQLYQHSIK